MQPSANCTYVVGLDCTVMPVYLVQQGWTPIYDTYLNSALYATGLVPCNFSVVYLTSFEDARAAVMNKSISYLVGNPSMTSCMAVGTYGPT